jgi:3-hydroxybutyryl-CoA dehydrogenase
MGPLRLCDLIGIDTLVLVADSLYAEHRSAEFVAPSLLRRYAEAGLLGRKSGRGFYEYGATS